MAGPPAEAPLRCGSAFSGCRDPLPDARAGGIPEQGCPQSSAMCFALSSAVAPGAATLPSTVLSGPKDLTLSSGQPRQDPCWCRVPSWGSCRPVKNTPIHRMNILRPL